MAEENQEQNEANDEAAAEEAEVTEPVAEAAEEPASGVAAEAPPAAEEPAEAPVAEAGQAEPEARPEPAEEPVAEAEEAEQAVAEAEEAEQAVAEAEQAEPTAEAVEEAPSGEPAAEVAAVPARKKKKRLPRALRPQRTKPKRQASTERKPITRLPKPEHARGRRQERQGAVVSAAGDKTIVVRVDMVKAHPVYKKVIRRSTRLHAHDERNEAKVGDIVRIVETRPVSRLKRWRLQEIVEAAK
jgi:small subunit ribosomal protein S17